MCYIIGGLDRCVFIGSQKLGNNQIFTEAYYNTSKETNMFVVLLFKKIRHHYLFFFDTIFVKPYLPFCTILTFSLIQITILQIFVL